jgi:hypothetical protein
MIIPDHCDDLKVCAGPGNITHCFMKYKGYNCCEECNTTICKTCSFIIKDNSDYCVNCNDGTQFADMDRLDNNKSPEEMVSQLMDRGYQIALMDHLKDIVYVYNTVIVKERGIYSESILQSVSVPE